MKENNLNKKNISDTDSPSTSSFQLKKTLVERLLNFGFLKNEGDTNSNNLKNLIEQHEEEQGELDEESKLLLRNLLSFGDLKVNDVMIPRADIVAVGLSSSIDKIIKAFQKESHSRMPVYKDNLDDVSGVIHIKDIVKFWDRRKAFKLSSHLKEALFVPPSMSVPDLLLTMRTKRLHMALVVDEYGGTDGLVTIEDLVESIVGDIEDEHDEDEKPLFNILSDGTIEASGRASTADVEKSLGADFLPEHHDEEIDTVAGVVASLAGRVPQRGEVISHNGGFEFEITQADARRVKKLIIRKITQIKDERD
ncbi:MAG: Hemolysin C [Alphaproteobacteria bacterium MarineAlpha2_Bin1]|nr:MAG: Hemolysin C [Alphaproteobacteria bacterium MarineAlpha2_Bin1]|tara:strand:+ start:3150 stop:4073 length:924 start_codon:yes stop_codon:yes gene_type:complete